VESGELGRPHTVSRGLMQHMQLMAAHAAFLTFAADAPRMKTKKNIIVRASRDMFFVSNNDAKYKTEHKEMYPKTFSGKITF